MEESKAKRVSGFVASRLEWLHNNPESGETKAALANMRRGVGKTPGEIPALWGLLFDGFPENLMGFDGNPSEAEWAVYTALTLFSVHQQSKSLSDAFMSRENLKFGNAVRLLAHNTKPEDDEFERVRRKFNIVATSADIRELSHHLRGLIQLMRSEGIPLDYPKLAADLYEWQFPDGLLRVRLNWGQDFYRASATAAFDMNDTSTNDNSES